MSKGNSPTPQHRSGRWRFPLMVLLLLVLFLSVPVLGRLVDGVGEALSSTFQSILRTFGIGPAVLIAAVLLFLMVRGWMFLLRRWHRWVGGVVLVVAMFGILSYFRPQEGLLAQATLGGSLGRFIAGPIAWAGVLRIALLVYLGLLLVAPGITWRLTRSGGLGVGRGARGTARGLGRLPAALRPPVRKALPPGRSQLPAIPAQPPPPPQTPQAAPPQPPAPPPTPVQIVQQPSTPPQAPVITASGWELPTPDILDPTTASTFGPGDVERRAETLQKALAEYGVEARVVGWNVGPTVTQFEVEPGWDVKYREVKEKDPEGVVHISRQEVSRTRVKVDRLTALGNDLALALAAPSIRIEAPVPGKSIVGIEVPNTSLGVVPLRGVIESPQFQRLRHRTKLAVALGKGVGGEAMVADLARMPHLLISGATGSGKSVCINSLICCLALYNTPEELKMVLIDPKRVEFTTFNTLPHLVMPVVVDREKAVEALRWLVKEMDARYKALSGAGARNIEEFNRTRGPGEAMPYITLFVDELADLMTVAFDETEKNLCRLAQLARATGIHLAVATQRPSVDVVTGLIKANFPTRISFALSSQVDSRTILDTAGAEKLLGRGDMLYLPTDAPRPRRLQGCFVSDAEIERLVAFWRRQRRAVPAAPRPAPAGPPSPEAAPSQEPPPPADPLLETARRLAREHHHISASFLQRRLQIGSPRAIKLMELLEEEGTITGRDNKGARE